MGKCVLLKLRQRYQEVRDARNYTEKQVKDILYAFARDLGCKWRSDRLRSFIDEAFDFD